MLVQSLISVVAKVWNCLCWQCYKFLVNKFCGKLTEGALTDTGRDLVYRLLSIFGAKIFLIHVFLVWCFMFLGSSKKLTFRITVAATYMQIVFANSIFAYKRILHISGFVRRTLASKTDNVLRKERRKISKTKEKKMWRKLSQTAVVYVMSQRNIFFAYYRLWYEISKTFFAYNRLLHISDLHING